MTDQELPPMPDDPATCRWCRGARMDMGAGLYICGRGCADNDQAPYLGHCEDCRATFHSGAKYELDQCWRCAYRERTQYRAQYADRGRTRYAQDMNRRGMRRQDVA